MTWGVDAYVIERFTAAGISAGNITTEKDTFHFQSQTQGSEQFINLLPASMAPR